MREQQAHATGRKQSGKRPWTRAAGKDARDPASLWTPQATAGLQEKVVRRQGIEPRTH